MAKVEPFEVVPWDVVRARITRLVFRFLRDRDRKMRAVSPGSPSFATVYRVCARGGQETIPILSKPLPKRKRVPRVCRTFAPICTEERKLIFTATSRR